MRRRDLIALVAGAAALRPLAAVAQQPERVRRVGIVTGLGENDPATKARLAAFRAAMAALGWAEGRNLRIDTRYAPGAGTTRATLAAELVALQPDVVLAHGQLGVRAVLAVGKPVPIVFVVVVDPVGQGFVKNLAHPGGDITGFTSVEPSFGPKWLELLKEIAPDVRRVAVLARPGEAYLVPAIAAAAAHFSVEVTVPPVRSPAEIEAVLAALGATPGGGLVLPTSIFTAIHRKQIIALAIRYRLPLVTGNPPYPKDGGLLYYGADITDLYRRSAAYVDRILRGAKPADLPVQQPTKFALIINLKTAKAMGLTVPQLLLAQADEVIE
jgi:ABC-type uncharacterized transport system substrate-binding protein